MQLIYIRGADTGLRPLPSVSSHPASSFIEGRLDLFPPYSLPHRCILVAGSQRSMSFLLATFAPPSCDGRAPAFTSLRLLQDPIRKRDSL